MFEWQWVFFILCFQVLLMVAGSIFIRNALVNQRGQICELRKDLSECQTSLSMVRAELERVRFETAHNGTSQKTTTPDSPPGRTEEPVRRVSEVRQVMKKTGYGRAEAELLLRMSGGREGLS